MLRILVASFSAALVASVSGCAAVLGAVGLDNSADVCDELDRTANDMVGVIVLAATNPLAFDLYAEKLSSQAAGLSKVRPTNPELRSALVAVSSEMTGLLEIVKGTNDTATVGDFASSLAATQLAIAELNSLCEKARN